MTSAPANPHVCSHCRESIQEGERWEYTKGAYPISAPEDTKERIHSRCVAQLLRETIAAFARVPEEQRDPITFEI